MLRTLVVDDERPARQRLVKLLEPLQEEGLIDSVLVASDGVEALEMLEDDEVELLLLDVQMPELTGFDVLQRLDPERRPVVVFTTAFDEYAVRAFDEHAVDYLLKPIDRDRLREAVERARRLEENRKEAQRQQDRLLELTEWVRRRTEKSDYPRHLSIPYRDRTIIVKVDDLVTAEINEGITRLFVLESEEKLRQHVVNYTLEQLESNLDPDRFMRVHRSAIVQIDHIHELISWFSGRLKLVMTTGHEVIASRDRARTLKERLSIE